MEKADRDQAKRLIKMRSELREHQSEVLGKMHREHISRTVHSLVAMEMQLFVGSFSPPPSACSCSSHSVSPPVTPISNLASREPTSEPISASEKFEAAPSSLTNSEIKALHVISLSA